MSRSSELDPIAFLSYVHADDEASEGAITEFRIRLEREIKMQTGSAVTIFQDRRDLKWGDEWRRRIESSIDSAALLIPIVTPSFFKSEPCRSELERFIAREQRLGRSDLIFPVYYVTCPLVEDAVQQDPLALVVSERHYTDWRDLRLKSFSSPKVARRLVELAIQLADALTRQSASSGDPHASPQAQQIMTMPTASAQTRQPYTSYLEDVAAGATFNSEKVSAFRRQMRDEVISEMPAELTAAEFLRRAGLLRDRSLTYAGLLLFGDDPTVLMPTAIVQCARFHGTSKGDTLDSIEIRDNVSGMIIRSRDFVAKLARVGEMPTAEGAYAEPVYSYPMIAMREIIANAVVHRDYELHESCVQIHAFTDRIEIISPGGWGTSPDTAQTEYLLSQLTQPSQRRNFRLAQTLTWSRLVEGVGAGLPRALADCAATGAPEPVVTLSGGAVTVTVYPRESLPGSADGSERYAWPVRASQPNPNSPVFFLSYARASEMLGGDRPHDRDRLVAKFFADLSENVSNLIGRPAGAEPGYLDRSIQSGARWTDDLLEAIGTSQVFVALLSVPYFRSSWCSMEWFAFSQRQVAASRIEPGGQSNVIPVVWAPVPADQTPGAVNRIQRFVPAGLPDRGIAEQYQRDGVMGLLLMRRESAYQAVVWRLAQHIAELYLRQQVEPLVLRESDLRDTFHEE